MENIIWRILNFVEEVEYKYKTIDMTLQEFAQYFGFFSLSTALAFGIIKYLSQSIFENYLQKSLETHKSELEKLNISYQIRFSSLHLERATIIKEIYHLLHDYKLSILEFLDGDLNNIHPEENLRDILNEWSEAAVNFNSTFHKNKIYFTEEQVQMINDLDKEIDKINRNAKSFLSTFKTASQTIEAIKNKNSMFNELQNNCRFFLDRVSNFESQLENEFRKILSVNI